MTRSLLSVVILAVATTNISAQGLPMTDQLGGSDSGIGTGVYGLGGGNNYSNPGFVPAPGGYATMLNNANNRPQFQSAPGISPQQMQQIANAAAQLGPAIQQAHQNLQQMRQQNGGYLLPRNQNRGFRPLRNRLAQPQGFQPAQRYTEGDWTGANWAADSLRRNGYRNVQVVPHPHNGFRQRQGLAPVYGVYHNGRR